MSRRARELETLLLAMVAAVPLYVTGAIGIIPILLFHGVMAAIAVRVVLGKGPELLPAALMRVLAFAYIPFYVVDAAMISRSAIAASTHLILFIAAYQPGEGLRSNNQAQRMLTTALIFIASLATSTHISVVLFVIVFGFLMFRQMMYVSHVETVRSIGRQYSLAPSSRSAFFYLAGAAAIGVLLFPMLPRVRNPFVQGYGGMLPGASTGISESINLNEPRGGGNDATVVARVWMDQQTVPFFTPLRLRGTVYDLYKNGEWTQSKRRRPQPVAARNGIHQIARPVGFTRPAIVQQQPLENRLFLPVGTYAVSGVRVFEGPTRDAWSTSYSGRPQTMTFNVDMAFDTEPFALRRIDPPQYPVTPAVAALARQIVGNETNLQKRIVALERYFQSNFKYMQSAAGQRPFTVDEFLLRERRGHCEYFAAGEVALLTALDVPSRIVGGFHGGQLNPLTGYFTVRREDAHAWVEVWDGTKWITSDPTPPSLRPGNTQLGLWNLYASAVGDSVTYFWDRYVLTYGLTDQIALMTEAFIRLREGVSNVRSGFGGGIREVTSPAYLTLLALVLLSGAAAIVHQRRHRPLFELLAAHLRRLGIDVGPAMTMEEALAQLREQQPDSAAELTELIALYDAERFSPSPDRARAAAIRKRLTALRA